ncbi:MAG: pyruvate ferredoxin oxidoreductase [Chloroflexi bacterium]|nr:pyruvate ferredoxin oxidoreductase [Chloroflexota bacterium]MBT4515535.1 pyruvate ferredoxin oxidoreductase [Chloroflexota bacterium]
MVDTRERPVSDDAVEAAPSTAIAVNGGEAIAYALKQIEPEVVAAYPITPQTLIIEKFAEYCADGVVRTEYINVESEHAALSACVGASAAGARAITATAGPGLALMFEMLGVTSGMRLPIVMHLCTRALSAPLNILGDHSDAMAMRETGWVMLSGSSPQEAYDLALVAQTVAEHPDVMLPCANLVDGFMVTHAVERVDVLPDDVVRDYVGEYEPETSLLAEGSTATYGALDFRDYYFEHRRQQEAALYASQPVVEASLKRFGEISGRHHQILEPYRMDDAEVVLVFMGSAEGQAHAAVDAARAAGVKAGALRIRLLRPFPVDAIAEALSGARVVGVMDRAIGFGSAVNPLLADIKSALWSRTDRPLMKGFVYGLGGRVVTLGQLNQALGELVSAFESGEESTTTTYLGLREDPESAEVSS